MCVPGQLPISRVGHLRISSHFSNAASLLNFHYHEGHIVTLGFAQKGNVSFPASAFANRGRTFHAGQQGGLQMLRDLPRYVKLIEKGLFDARSLVTASYPLDRVMEAVQAVADRTTVGAVVTFS